jgi:hypothetical protein
MVSAALTEASDAVASVATIVVVIFRMVGALTIIPKIKSGAATMLPPIFMLPAYCVATFCLP